MRSLPVRLTLPITLPCRGPLSACLVALACCGCGGMAKTDNAEGVKLYQQGNYLGAVNSFQQALAKQPGNPDCFYNLGATYHQQAKLFARPADMQTAEQYYHLCLARNPNHEACQRALAVLLVEENRRDEAVGGLQAWARSQPTNPDPHVELARLAQESGDVGEAEKQLVDALAVDPANTRALVALGSLRETSGDTMQALATYSRALAVDPQQPAVAAKVANLQATVARTAALPPPAVPTTVVAPPPVPPGNAGR
ncbi:MAG: tetratricopeptide repeat protein [Pirellulales bacterium]